MATRQRVGGERLAELVEEHPTQRFGQILRNFGFVDQTDSLGYISWRDEFSREPWDVLARVQDRSGLT